MIATVSDERFMDTSAAWYSEFVWLLIIVGAAVLIVRLWKWWRQARFKPGSYIPPGMEIRTRKTPEGDNIVTEIKLPLDGLHYPNIQVGDRIKIEDHTSEG